VKITFSDVTTADAARSRALTERFFPALGDDFEVKWVIPPESKGLHK
jgi:hypothetical protein